MAQLAPDWWMRGVMRPGSRNAPLETFLETPRRGGGAKNGAEHRAERRAEPCATKGADEEGSFVGFQVRLLVRVGLLFLFLVLARAF